jgi:hypothetical protein
MMLAAFVQKRGIVEDMKAESVSIMTNDPKALPH